MPKKKIAKIDLKDAIIKGMQEKKANKITVLDLRKLKVSMADYFIICHGEDIYGYFKRLIDALENSNLISNIFAFPFSKVKPQDPIFNNLIETKQYISDYNVQNQF